MGDLDPNLVLQILVLLISALIACMVRKGWLDRKTVEDAKDIANATATGIDKLKDFDPTSASMVLREVVSKIGDKKGVLDAFLKSVNLNAPKGADDGEGDGG